jgi:tetratricopeptide (TPR) repeat protein
MENNPYNILGVSPAASKAEITKALALAMKRKQYPVDVIAKAQKSLLKPEERIIADYLRPILPSIQRFQDSDLSALETPAPTLTLLSEFDGLEQAIAQSNQEELLEQEPIATPLSTLRDEGIAACQEGRYPKAIKYLEDYCHSCPERQSQDYIQAQIWLIRAYQMGGQLQRAISLCQQLTTHNHPQVQTWANNSLAMLHKEISRV